MQYASLWLIFLFGPLLASCEKLSNAYSTAKMQCGEEEIRDGYFLVPVLGLDREPMNAAALEAFIIDAEHGDEPLQITSRACVRHKRQETRPLLVRTTSGQSLAALQSISDEDEAPRLLLQVVSQQSPVIDCKSGIFANSDHIELGSFLRGSYNPAAIRLELQYAGSKGLSLISHKADKGWPAYLAELPHGPHQLSLRVINLLRTEHPRDFESCVLNMDKERPEPKIAQEAHFTLDHGYRVWTKNPGATIEISMQDDGFPQSVFYCLQALEDPAEEAVCSEDEFRASAGLFSAPETGLWKLSYYAIDKAGNRSDTKQERFLVYHSSAIENIQALINLASFEFNEDRQMQAISHLLQAEMKRQQLSKWEAQDFYYPVLQGFLSKIDKLSQKLVFQPKTDLAHVQAIAYTPDGQHLVLGGAMPHIQVYNRKGRLLRELGHIDNAGITAMGFSESGDVLWVHTHSGSTRILAFDGSSSCSIPAIVTAFQNPKRKDIFFQRYTSDRLAFSIYDRHCAEVQTIASNASIGAGTLSPDLESLATMASDEAGNNVYKLFRTNDLAQAPRILSKAAGPMDLWASSVFSPDGAWLAFCGSADLVVMHRDDPLKDFTYSERLETQSGYRCEFLDDDNFLMEDYSQSVIVSLSDREPFAFLSQDGQRIFNKKLRRIFDIRHLPSQRELQVGVRNWFDLDPKLEITLNFPEWEWSRFALNPQTEREFATIDPQHVVSVWEPLHRDLLRHPSSQTLTSLPLWHPNGDGYVTLDPSGASFSYWDQKHKLLRSLTMSIPGLPRREPIHLMRIDPSGRFLAGIDPHGDLRLWTLDGKALKHFSFEPESDVSIRDMEFSADGERLLVFESAGTLTVIDSQTLTMEQKKIAASLAHDPLIPGSDGFLLLTNESGTDSMIHLNRDGTPGKSLEFPARSEALYAKNGDHLASISSENHIIVSAWDGADPQDFGAISPIHMPTALQFSPDGELWVIYQSGRIDKHGPEGFRRSLTTGLNTGAKQVHWDKAQNYWVTGDGSKAEFRSRSDQLLLSLDDPTGALEHLSLSPSGTLFASKAARDSGEVSFWSTTPEKVLPSLCTWVKDYLAIHGENFPGVPEFCESILKN